MPTATRFNPTRLKALRAGSLSIKPTAFNCKTHIKRVAILMLLSSCHQQILPPTQPLSTRDAIHQRVKNQCQQSSQCQAIGIQPLACGGYADYLVYSRWKTSEKRLKQMISDYNQGWIKQNKKKNKGISSSICQHIAKPVLRCEQRTCQAQNNRDPH